MKKTKAQKLNEAFIVYKAEQQGQRPPRQAKDGSIPTYPTVPVAHIPESEVLARCLKWLRKHRVFCDRHDCGGGDLGYGYARYGIRGAGDIIGILPSGRHFEVECKAGKGGRLSKEQQDRMRDVRLAGGIYIVAHGVTELEDCMRGLV